MKWLNKGKTTTTKNNHNVHGNKRAGPEKHNLRKKKCYSPEMLWNLDFQKSTKALLEFVSISQHQFYLQSSETAYCLSPLKKRNEHNLVEVKYHLF